MSYPSFPISRGVVADALVMSAGIREPQLIGHSPRHYWTLARLELRRGIVAADFSDSISDQYWVALYHRAPEVLRESVHQRLRELAAQLDAQAAAAAIDAVIAAELGAR